MKWKILVSFGWPTGRAAAHSQKTSVIQTNSSGWQGCQQHDWYAEPPWEDVCQINSCYVASCQVITEICQKLRGEPVVGLPSQKGGIVVRWSSLRERTAACRQVGEWYFINDSTERLRMIFALLLVSALWLREVMHSYKGLHIVPGILTVVLYGSTFFPLRKSG